MPAAQRLRSSIAVAYGAGTDYLSGALGASTAATPYLQYLKTAADIGVTSAANAGQADADLARQALDAYKDAETQRNSAGRDRANALADASYKRQIDAAEAALQAARDRSQASTDRVSNLASDVASMQDAIDAAEWARMRADAQTSLDLALGNIDGEQAAEQIAQHQAAMEQARAAAERSYAQAAAGCSGRGAKRGLDPGPCGRK